MENSEKRVKDKFIEIFDKKNPGHPEQGLGNTCLG